MPELLEDAELVRHWPIFNYPPLDKAHDTDLRPLHAFPRRGDTSIGTLMCGLPRSASRDLVSFSDLVLNRDLYVREGDTSGGHNLLDCLARYRLPIEEDRRGEHFVHHFQPLFVPDVFEKAPERSPCALPASYDLPS
jgi:hypothetical protein